MGHLDEGWHLSVRHLTPACRHHKTSCDPPYLRVPPHKEHICCIVSLSPLYNISCHLRAGPPCSTSRRDIFAQIVMHLSSTKGCQRSPRKCAQLQYVPILEHSGGLGRVTESYAQVSSSLGPSSICIYQ